MYKRSIFAMLLVLAVLGLPAFAQVRTVVHDQRAKRTLLGKHMLSLQWISWDHFGTANATERNGLIRIKGEQRGRGENRSDYLRLNGVVTSIDSTEFLFSGKIEMRISHINGGEPCVREGEFTFRVTGRRKYWRMQEMDNPCDTATDYVDIYFR